VGPVGPVGPVTPMGPLGRWNSRGSRWFGGQVFPFPFTRRPPRAA